MGFRPKRNRRSYSPPPPGRRPRDFRRWDEDFPPDAVNSNILTVPTLLPPAVAVKARRKIYTYPGIALAPLMWGRTRQLPLQKRSRQRLVPVAVRIRVPRRLPSVPSHMVTFYPSRGYATVHSRKQIAAAVAAPGELNRRRYAERKDYRRRARNGQLLAPGALAFGSVSALTRLGADPRRIADAALVARAILRGR